MQWTYHNTTLLLSEKFLYSMLFYVNKWYYWEIEQV